MAIRGIQVAVAITSTDLILITPMQNAGTEAYGPIDLQDPKLTETKSLAATPGVHLFLGDDSAALTYLLHYLSHSCASGGKIAGIRFPALNSTILVGGSKRTVHEMSLLAGKLSLDKTPASRSLEQICMRPLNLAHHESLALLQQHIRRESYAIVPFEGTGVSTADLHQGIANINQMAATANAHVMLVTATNEPKEMSALQYAATACFHFSRAEEDPDCALAWALGNTDRDYRHTLGSGRDMVQVKPKNGGLAFVTEPLISMKLKERVMWKCISSDLTQEDAGHVVNKNKATVSRCMRSGLPRPSKKNLKPGWWQIYTDIFEFSDEIREKLGE